MFAMLLCGHSVTRSYSHSLLDFIRVYPCRIDKTTIRKPQLISSQGCSKCMVHLFCLSSKAQAGFDTRLLVLTSQKRSRPVTFSLTTPAPQPTPGEAAISDLLRIVRSPRTHFDARTQALKLGPLSPLSRAPSFLSGGLPRDRRGRIAHKQKGKGVDALVLDGVGDSDDAFGDETPRNGPSHMLEVEREREREFLEALRSVGSFVRQRKCLLTGCQYSGVLMLRARLPEQALAGGVWVQGMRISASRQRRRRKMNLWTGIRRR